MRIMILASCRDQGISESPGRCRERVHGLHKLQSALVLYSASAPPNGSVTAMQPLMLTNIVIVTGMADVKNGLQGKGMITWGSKLS